MNATPSVKASTSVKSRKPARAKYLQSDLQMAQLTPELRKRAACVLEVARLNHW